MHAEAASRASVRAWWSRVVAPALLSAALLSCAFPPIEVPALAWLAFAPILASIAHGLTGPRSRALGMLFGLTVAAWNLPWLVAVFDVAGAALWLVFAAFAAIVVGALAAVRARWGAPIALVAAPPLWIGVEVFRSELWPLRFGWLGAGYSLAASDLWIQGADLAGVYGLGLAVLSVGALVAGASLPVSRRARASLVVAALAVPTLLGAYGARRLAAPHAQPTVRVAAIQYETQSLEDGLALLGRAPGDTRLVVAPELGAAFVSGAPAHLDAPPLAQALRDASRASGAILVVGGTRDAPGDSPIDGFYNSLAIVEPDGRTSYVTKAEPVPLFADGARAEAITPRATSLGTLGAAICYDATHPHVVGALAPAAQLLVIASGDLASWTELQHVQHARMVRMRAVEHRRWVVRATSSGISQVIDPHGAIHAELGFGETGVIDARVALSSERTTRDTLGAPLSTACVAVAALVLAAVAIDEARRRRAA